MKKLRLLSIVCGCLNAILLTPTNSAHAVTVTYLGTDYEVTTIGPVQHESIPILLQSQPWWGNSSQASDFSILVADQLGFPNDSANDGPYFAFNSYSAVGPTFVDAYTYADDTDSAELREMLGYGTSYTWATASAIPIPPALWLFGSGLLGLVGVARRKEKAI